MKRNVFRLDSVLRNYSHRKTQADHEWVRELNELAKIEAIVRRLEAELAAAGKYFKECQLRKLTVSTLRDCLDEMERLERELRGVRELRERQRTIVKACEAKKIHWAIKEESLQTLKDDAKILHQEMAEKADNLNVDETVLRQWMNGPEADNGIG